MIKRSECQCSCHRDGSVHIAACCEPDEPLTYQGVPIEWGPPEPQDEEDLRSEDHF